MKGLSSNLGCANLIDCIPDKDGLIVNLLVQQTGLIPFVTSTVPQCLMLNETVNRVYGRCRNPWDESRTPGGSSGGESALVASGCSPLGIGSDIGGSVRVPCLYTGLYGIKVTNDRLTFLGVNCVGKSQKRANINIKACFGPMAKTVEDVSVVLRSLLVDQMFQNDLDVVPLAWNEALYTDGRKMRIGYVENDPFFNVSKGNQRAVSLAVEALKAKGHEIVKLEYPNFAEAVTNYIAIMSAAGRFRPFSSYMGDEPPIAEYTQMIKLMRIPMILRKVMAFIFPYIGENRAARLFPRSAEKSAWELLQESEKQQVIKKEFFDWWRQNRIDALVSPGLPSAALKHGHSTEAFLSLCYSLLFNLIDLPTGVVPVGKVKKEEETYEDPIHKDRYSRKIKETMIGSEGMPLGVQISALPYQEEIVLNLLKQVESVVGFHELPLKF